MILFYIPLREVFFELSVILPVGRRPRVPFVDVVLPCRWDVCWLASDETKEGLT